MNQHKASNGTSVHLDSNGRMTFRRDSPLCVNTLEAFWVQAAREYFQAERDQELGRWRDPENPDYVVYPRPDQDDDDGRCVSLFDESSEESWMEWERTALPGPALRYFDAHPQPEPEPKPWEDAQPGEFWILTVDEKTDPYKIWTDTQRVRRFERVERPYTTICLNDPRITAGHRVWPEEDK